MNYYKIIHFVSKFCLLLTVLIGLSGLIGFILYDVEASRWIDSYKPISPNTSIFLIFLVIYNRLLLNSKRQKLAKIILIILIFSLNIMLFQKVGYIKFTPNIEQIILKGAYVDSILYNWQISRTNNTIIVQNFTVNNLLYIFINPTKITIPSIILMIIFILINKKLISYNNVNFNRHTFQVMKYIIYNIFIVYFNNSKYKHSLIIKQTF